MTTYPEHRIVPPLEWMRTLRDGIDVAKSTKTVGLCLALHAKPDGTSAHPGWKRLSWESGCSRRTVIAALGELEAIGLLYCVERGSQLGRENRASSYSLTLHDNLAMLTTPFERWLEANGAESLAQTGKRLSRARQPAHAAGASDPWA